MKDKNSKKVKIQELTLQDIKQEEKKIEPPPPPPPEAGTAKSGNEAIHSSYCKKDEEVEKPPPPVEELKDVKIADVSQEGVKDNEIPTPAVIDEGKQIVEEKKEEDENNIFDKVEIEASFPVAMANGVNTWKETVTGR